MFQPAKLLLFAAFATGCVVTVPVSAQDTAPSGPPAAAGTDVGNWGFLPYGLAPTLLLSPDQKVSLRELEDRQLQELRALEDRYEAELREIRVRHAQERATLVDSFSH